MMTMSLTKKQLLAELVCTKPEKLKEHVFGQEAWVKPVSEFQRSRRLAALYGKDGEVSRDAIRKARLYTIVDHLCDQNGENLFKESDIKDLMELDALKLDVVIGCIEPWVSSREGKILGGSKK
jgi:hypothetical protein